MGDFVSDHHTDGPIIHRVIRLQIEERRLQNAGRKNNLVQGRAEVGVDRLRGHVPFGPIHGLADPRQIPSGFKGIGPEHVAQVIVPSNLQPRIITEALGVPHFLGETVKLLESLPTGGFAHPLQLGEPLPEYDAQVGDHFRHAC